MVVHQCANFFNNPRLVHKRATRHISNYLVITSTHVELPDGNRQVFTHGVVYNPYKEKFIECYVDSGFSGKWSQADSNNAENVILRTGYVIVYAV